MQEARNVVSSPRWQNPADAGTVQPADAADDKRDRKDDASTDVTAKTAEPPATARTPDDNRTDLSTTSKTATAATEAANTAEPDDDGEQPAYVPRNYTYRETPTMSRGPMLGIVTAASVAAAAWSYTTLETTRAQLASVISSKASLEQSLSDARSKLATAEKTVADVKAAITAATAKPAAK